ncbi:lipopolysaccharide biosynthesis protein [Nocardioides hankookensis]|uniref:Lipopolysaccharide biosynthesis protein n=1 Tax=Nocardioides hankookensis TaxID=443157 RepID=A0ABW1LLQ9_9ACTN
MALWWFGYALVFLAAQILTALCSPAWGAFVGYSAINAAYLVIQVPYLLLSNAISIRGILTAAVVSTSIAALVGGSIIALVLNRFRRRSATDEPSSTNDVGLRDLTVIGFPMMIARLIQASLPWAPVWILLLVGTAGEAAIYAAASRLTVAVTSVVAAIRFSVRPRLVLLLTDEAESAIARFSRQCSAVAALPPACGILGLTIAGVPVISAIFGADYVDAVPVLTVLMFGVLAEAFGGVSDEILKMSGRTYVVLLTLGAASAFQILVTPLVARSGVVFVGVVTAGAFAIQYFGQVAWLSRFTAIQIWPILPERFRYRAGEQK